MSKKQKRTRHGLHSLMDRVKANGMAAVDRRSRAYRAVSEFRADLATSLGGEENLSAQQNCLIDLAAREYLFLAHADAFLMSQETLLVGRGKKKVFLPLVKERGAIAARLAGLMNQLGLERRTRPIPNLMDYLREKQGGGGK